VVADPAIRSDFPGNATVNNETVDEVRTVNLPADLCAQIEKKFGQRFGNLQQLLEFLLRELLRDEAAEADEGERLLIEQRLRELGYL
jgi:hypothetical protein